MLLRMSRRSVVDGTDEPIVANDFPDRIRSISPGVKSFNGRTGDVVPAEGDYTAEQVGALPTTGGAVSGTITTYPFNNLPEQRGVSIGYKENSEISGMITISGNGSGRTIEFHYDTMSKDISIYKYMGTTRPTNELVVIRGVSTPILDDDAANKAYVDSVAGGFSVASNAGAHNSLFRGKYLGSSVTAAQYAAISAGTFDDLFIGDYWTINSVNWRIAAFDYYLGTGSAEVMVEAHHAVIVPDTNLDTQKMNDPNVTTGAYMGSAMYTTNIATARTKINTAFSGHVLTHQFFLSDSEIAGKVTHLTGVNQDVVLMSERNVYGQTIMSSECAIGGNSVSPKWITFDRTQFQLFALAPEFIQKSREPYWLRDIAADTFYAAVGGTGSAVSAQPIHPSGVRPAFSIKG